MLARRTAHFLARHERCANLGPLRFTEQCASQIVRELHAPHAGWLAVRHAWDWRRDRGRNTACTAVGAAVRHRYGRHRSEDCMGTIRSCGRHTSVTPMHCWFVVLGPALRLGTESRPPNEKNPTKGSDSRYSELSTQRFINRPGIQAGPCTASSNAVVSAQHIRTMVVDPFWPALPPIFPTGPG
jgi:hypothetical protein